MLVSNGFPSFTKPPPSSNIRGRVVVKDMYDHEQNNWPDRFMFAPRVGDQIQAEDGRRLTVLDIVHTIMDGQPSVRIEGGGSMTGVEGY